ncbi:nucleoside deaminase [Flavivirga sp. 57AJ16]|uniref:nucleoside deaminase n=1 Tax=Flavivirga sp. 57AJ16 TaxID=3025307 RepID=UPI002365DF36|nr:nucleoside deaminase [Flavivirga sp. 57AJ16]
MNDNVGHTNSRFDNQSDLENVKVDRFDELDEIYSLLSYSIVQKYWESDDLNGRGYNVGVVLVDENQNVVDWDINSVNVSKNSTQHGEMRLISRYLDQENLYSLKGYTIFPTLEPCAMCAGMMVMTNIHRSVNGQMDYYYSKALERLSIDTEACGGYPPYPRSVISQISPSSIAMRLDQEYKKYIDRGNSPIITKFLSTPAAKIIYDEAIHQFLNFKCKFPENKLKYENAIKFYNHLPESI